MYKVYKVYKIELRVSVYRALIYLGLPDTGQVTGQPKVFDHSCCSQSSRDRALVIKHDYQQSQVRKGTIEPSRMSEKLISNHTILLRTMHGTNYSIRREIELRYIATGKR